MLWKSVRFKGQEVWAEVDAAGAPVVKEGRRQVRYKATEGATIYRASAAAIEDLPGSPRELPEGQAAPEGGGRGAARAGSGRGSGFGSAGSRTVAQAEAGRADAKARIEAIRGKRVLAFTDGACTGNPGPAGSGAVVVLLDGTVVERHRALGPEETNNIGELTAVGLALGVLRERELPRDTPVTVFTDSDYTIGMLARGWKAKANGGLIAALKRALGEWSDLELQWVPGHVGVPENERADALARKGVEESRRM